MTSELPHVPDLAKWIRNHAAHDQLSLSYSEATALNNELKRLEQSADRLRKQNRKVRIKIDRIRAEHGVTAESEPDDPPD